MRRAIAKYLRRLEAHPGGSLADWALARTIALYRRARGAVERRDNRFLSGLFLRWKHAERGLVGWRYRFVTLAELTAWTNEWVKSLPSDCDVVVGIPRSGLLVAAIVALKLGKPLTTPELFLENRYWMSQRIERAKAYGRILLIDDSISSGETFEQNLALIRSAGAHSEVIRGALIVTPEGRPFVDQFYVEIPQPRLFEWNMLHVKRGVLAVDLDGVICENCPPGVDADDVRYAAWVRTARPYLIPTFEIDFIVSSRLERYRKETEEWLSRHGVRYQKLMLWEIASKQEGRGRHAEQKIEKLLRIKPEMFWESSGGQAREIWRATRIPTLCVDEMRLLS